MKCPICHKPVDPSDAEAPFCSARCRLIDLGNWASGKYVISTPISPKAPNQTEDADPDEQ